MANLKISPQYLASLTRAINTVKRNSIEAFYQDFGVKITKVAENYISSSNPNSITLLLSKLCTSLIGYYFRQNDRASPATSNSRNISEREIAGLQYLGGFILRNVHYSMKKVTGFKSSIEAISAFKNEEKPTNQRLVSALDRKGSWYISNDFQNILLLAEKTFCFEVKNRQNLRLIDLELICSKIMDSTSVYEIFRNRLDDTDVVISDGESKDLLRALIQLYVRVRCFNFAKDVVQATKLKNIADQNTKKALRQNLKKANEEFDDIGV